MHNYEKGLTWNSQSYFTQSDTYDFFSQKEDAPDLVWKELKDRLKGNILDAGCGTGKYLKKCKEAGFTVLGIDRSSAQIKLASQKKLPAQVCNLLDLSNLRIKFDTIFSCWVLGTIPEKDRLLALSAMKQCLKAKGVIYLVENEPFCDFELIRGHASKVNNSTIYEQWLTAHGFEKELVLKSEFGFDTDEQATAMFKEIWGDRIKTIVPKNLNHNIVIWALKYSTN